MTLPEIETHFHSILEDERDKKIISEFVLMTHHVLHMNESEAEGIMINEGDFGTAIGAATRLLAL